MKMTTLVWLSATKLNYECSMVPVTIRSFGSGMGEVERDVR